MSRVLPKGQVSCRIPSCYKELRGYSEMRGVVYPAESVGQGGTVISSVKVKDTNCSAFLRIPHDQAYPSQNIHISPLRNCPRAS